MIAIPYRFYDGRGLRHYWRIASDAEAARVAAMIPGMLRVEDVCGNVVWVA
jgi:hypothetical protein